MTAPGLQPSRARRLRAFAAGRSGSSAVEFAILSPVLLLFVFGNLVFGLYLGIAHSVQQLASEAARASVSGVTDQERGTLARGAVQAMIPSYGLLRPEKLQVTARADPADPDLFVVDLVYDASSLGLGGLSRLVPAVPSTVQRSAKVRRGGA